MLDPAEGVLQESLSVCEIHADVFRTINLTGCDPLLATFCATIAKHTGMRQEWEDVMTAAVTGKRIADVANADERYDALRPFRLNPGDARDVWKTLSKKERSSLERRAETIKELGLDALSDFDD